MSEPGNSAQNFRDDLASEIGHAVFHTVRSDPQGPYSPAVSEAYDYMLRLIVAQQRNALDSELTWITKDAEAGRVLSLIHI